MKRAAATWTRDLDIGIDLIDRQHRKIGHKTDVTHAT